MGLEIPIQNLSYDKGFATLLFDVADLPLYPVRPASSAALGCLMRLSRTTVEGVRARRVLSVAPGKTPEVANSAPATPNTSHCKRFARFNSPIPASRSRRG